MRMTSKSFTADNETLREIEEIKIILGTNSDSEAIREAVKRYRKENPRLQVTVEQLKDLLEEYLERVE